MERARIEDRNDQQTRHLGLGWALVLVITATASLGAQEAPAGTEQQPFADTIDVRVVEVETVVTGRDGSRLHDLRAEDFRLLVDGREVPIEHFEEVRLASRPSDASPRRPSSSEFREATAVPPASISYLVFLDDYFTHRGRRKRLIDNLVEDVASLGSGEQMAVVRYEGKTLEVISEWTSSRDQLMRALEDARRRTPTELLRRGRQQGIGNVAHSARLRARHIRQVTDAMAAAMRALSDVEGRKLFLPITTGWNFDPTLRVESPFEGVAADNGGFVTGSSTFAGLGELNDVSGYLNARLLAPITDAANLLGYTIYPMHVNGPGNVELTSLWAIARDTGGGIATQGAAAPSPLEPVREDVSSYYVLAFTPDWEWNDRRHEVDVEVRLEGATVRHRRDFRDLSRSTQRALRVEEALLVELTEGDLAVRLGERRKVKRSVVEVPVELEIPMDWVTAVPQGEVWTSALEVRIAALDKWGDRSEMPMVPVVLSGPKPEPGSHSIYETRLQLRAIRQRLVISVTDRLSGEARIAAIDLDL